ncbi:unnamed protein product [Notodromas monacha]|uniref:Choline/carnitine acyltransferase domain-containing protein n=1 Tax=Notodromas monacha TaxID=399045 RepID=A0A7R9BUC5_9CRUS|nr:unnamed protein product [Notodromas monacha]CAG0920829.1 unnamed protein product [Notodromas monacha]
MMLPARFGQLHQWNRCMSTVVSSNDYQYLHRSLIPTLHFQPSLPRLPIPKLEDTCERYIRCQSVVLEGSALENTKRLTEKFLQGEGRKLHSALIQVDKRNKHTSYISPMWFDMYLCDRRPIPLNHTPFIGYVDETDSKYASQIVRATNMLISSLRFFKTYREGLLEPDVFHLNPKKSDTLFFRKAMRLLPAGVSAYGAMAMKAFPLCMSQFPNLLQSTRLPQEGKDILRRYPESRHMLVMRNGNFYVFDALDENGNLFEPSYYLGCISHILKDNAPASEFPLGVMTAADRDTWTDFRSKLMALGNQTALNAVDSAIYCLTLDDDKIGDDRVALFRSFLHGEGRGNRWFDKSLSLHFTGDGKAAVTFEHSWGDGVAVLRFFNEVFNDSKKKREIDQNTLPSSIGDSTVRRLEFRLDQGMQQTIKSVQEEFVKKCDSLDVNAAEVPLFGKSLLKTKKLSPDSVMQLGIQLAQKYTAGNTAATYESCSTAAFRHGRTETVRSATAATKAFCDAVTAEDVTRSNAGKFFSLLQTCSGVHGQLTKEAAMGQGFDRHLFALKHFAEGRLPDLYTDEAYQKLNTIVLSTSTLSAPAVSVGGFAAVTPSGYGIGYGIRDKELGCVVTSYPGADGKSFTEALKRAYETIHRVLVAN